jgi:hypothetical protein
MLIQGTWVYHGGYILTLSYLPPFHVYYLRFQSATLQIANPLTPVNPVIPVFSHCPYSETVNFTLLSLFHSFAEVAQFLLTVG